jgi:glycerophosphoryl diester phosphodiesterase
MILDPAFTARPIAHRGLHDVSDGRPENSVEAIEAAIDGNYGIEIDLQPSKDGVPMVFHDYRLARLTAQSGPIAMRTAAQLSDIPLSGGAAGIPTLDEVLSLVAGRVPLLIEIKDQDGAMGPNVGTLEQATAKLLADYPGPVALMSFNPHAVAACAKQAPGIARGIVTSSYQPEAWAPVPKHVCDTLRDIPDYDRVGACFISHEVADLDRPRVADLKSQGATILCWTVKSATVEREARKIAEGITFDGYLA